MYTFLRERESRRFLRFRPSDLPSKPALRLSKRSPQKAQKGLRLPNSPEREESKDDCDVASVGLRSFNSRSTILMAWLKSADPTPPSPHIYAPPLK